MATVRNCPQCDRPNGPKASACMYCGAALPSVIASSSPAIQEPVNVVAEGRKARTLLEGLSTTARALMPVDVIAKLEAQSAAGDAAATRTQRSGPVTAEITLPEEETEPSSSPPATEAAYDLPEPSPEGDPSIPDIGAAGIESFDVRTVHGEDLVPYDSLAMAPSPSIAAAIAAAVEGRADQDFETALQTALTRGGGPFGRRESAARVILLPHPDYRGQAHWLRHRVADATGVDLYTATQILQRDVPSCLLMADTFEEAETAADHLREGGLQVLTIARDDWLDDALPEPVVSARIEDDGTVVFDRPDGTLLTVESADLRDGYIGQIAPDVAKIAMVPERDKRWGAAIPSGGRNLNVGSGPFVVMDLLRGSTRRPIRLRSDDFNFDCLGDDRGLSAVLNLRTLARVLSPDPESPLALNDRFKRVSHVTGLPTEGGDSRGRPLTRREVEFTEYVLLSDAPNHL